MDHLIKIGKIGNDPKDYVVKGATNVQEGASFIKDYLHDNKIDEKDAVIELRIPGEKEAKQLLILYLSEFSYRETFFQLSSKDIISGKTFQITMT